jgi:hypothetical protein
MSNKDNAFATSSTVGAPVAGLAESYVPGTEDLQDGELRVTVVGSGDPWPRMSQASGSLVVEVGDAERDFFFFDLGSGALMKFTGLHLPVTARPNCSSHICMRTTSVMSLVSLEVSGRLGESIRSRSGEDGLTTQHSVCRHSLRT